MVIVILGILAATVLPKFVNLSSDARKASLKGLEGAINGAKTIVKAGYLVNPAATVTLSDGTTVAVSTTGTIAGLPTATATGIGNAIEMSTDFTASYATGPNLATFTLQTNCFVTYTESTGGVASTTTGC